MPDTAKIEIENIMDKNNSIKDGRNKSLKSLKLFLLNIYNITIKKTTKKIYLIKLLFVFTNASY